MVLEDIRAHSIYSSSFKAREARLDLCLLAIEVAKELSLRKMKAALFVWTDVFNICCDHFSASPTFGDVSKTHFSKMIGMFNTIKKLSFDKVSVNLTTHLSKSAFTTFERIELSDIQQLLLLLWEDEIYRISAWLRPLVGDDANFLPPPVNERQVKWSFIVKTAWRINPSLAISLRSRFVNNIDAINAEIIELSKFSLVKVLSRPDALTIFLKNAKFRNENQLRHLLYWTPVAPVIAIQILSQSHGTHPWIIQYAIRSLEDFPITQVFFYIPQLVQGLRYDSLGYVEKYILEAAKSSQYFAHQIIWNMEANMYKDDDSTIVNFCFLF